MGFAKLSQNRFGELRMAELRVNVRRRNDIEVLHEVEHVELRGRHANWLRSRSRIKEAKVLCAYT